MTTNFEAISEVKTQPIYYHPTKFEKYQIITYKSRHWEQPWLEESLRQSLQNFEDEKRSEYIIGVGQPMGYRQSKFEVGSYEHFIEGAVKFQGTQFLQCALSTGAALLDSNGYRKDIDEHQKNLLIEFCQKYGLNRSDELLHRRMKNGDRPPHEFGCNVWTYIRGLESLSIAHDRLSQLRDGNFKEPRDVLLTETCTAEARITAMCMYSVREKRLKTFLYADSLLNIASYQLGKIMSDGVLTRKCANPACARIIVGGRSDKKTCSASCRKALERYQKGGPQHGEHQAH